jgi:hypothetical protein
VPETQGQAPGGQVPQREAALVVGELFYSARESRPHCRASPFRLRPFAQSVDHWVVR